MPTGGADLNIPDTNDDGSPGGDGDTSFGGLFNSVMPGDANWVEAYQRAATGGLFDPGTGDAAFVDTDGDFYQDGPAFDGATTPLGQIPDATVTVAETSGDAAANVASDAANVASDAVDVTADVVQDASGFAWSSLGWKGKAAVGLVGAAVLTQVFKPAISAGTTAAEVTQ